MTLGEKLSKLRRENNYTQEQLAGILGVSRQSISKWESDSAYPETEKLLRLGEIYNCSMDYLLKDKETADIPASKTVTLNLIKMTSYERKSKKSVFGLPLWHINIGYGRKAKGIIAVGFSAKGVISFGLFSLGILSFGVLGIGIFALGSIALGLLAVGAVSFGVIALGAVSVAVVSVGALAVGDFSVGAMAIGKYFAYGDNARALIAIGDTRAAGSLFQKAGELTASDIANIKGLLDENVPVFLLWAKELIKGFL